MWTDHSVFYQIYPLGFCGAPLSNDGVPAHRIRKVADWADYLEQLGIDCVLLNPVFESDTHGYDTRDLRKVDCRLGTNDDLRYVVDTLHAHGIRVVLDGVFNHVGRNFPAFVDVREKKWDSPYKDWFHIDFNGNSGYDDGFWYEGWEGHFELVKLNLRNPALIDYLLETVRLWIDTFDIDGLRLDVAYTLDHDYMHRLREFTSQIRPDFALIGEVLFGDYNQFVNDGMLHSCTNYECYKGIYSSFNSRNFFEISYSLNRQFGPEDWCLYRGKHLLSFVDNHDVTRAASILQNPAHLPLMYALLMGMPGIPCIYYGSEWGAEGQKEAGSDASLRPCFDAPVRNDLSDYIRRLIAIRKSSEALTDGDYRNVVVTNTQLVFSRCAGEETVFVCLNMDENAFTANAGELSGSFTELISGKALDLEGSFEIPACGAAFLKRNDGNRSEEHTC